MKKFISLLLCVFICLQFPTALAAGSVDYKWGNMPIGANGFITGILFHPLEKDLVYVRTDIGGAYRWDKENNKWIQLLNGLGRDDANLFGVDGFAIDPKDPDILYLAAGKYTWNPGEVLKSHDRGNTWEKTGFGQRFNSNGNALRAYGECIMVDPRNSNVIYCGTSIDGLWKSTDGATTWKQVKEIETLNDKTQGIRNVVFDPREVVNGVSKTIYIGVAGKGIYRSNDGGANWEFMKSPVITAKRMDFSKSGILYVASEQGLYKFENEQWTEISPEGKGLIYNGITIDPTDENVLMCVGPHRSSDRMNMSFWRSTDGGKTWVNKRKTAEYSNILPWNKSRDMSANTHDIKIDPFNPKRVMLSDWLNVWVTEDITADPTQKWTNPIYGIELCVPRDAITPPTGKYNITAGIMDIDGISYDSLDLTKYPTKMARVNRQEKAEPYMMSVGNIDFCEEDPNIVLRVGEDWNTDGKLEYSLDGTETWHNIYNIPHYVDKDGNKGRAVTLGKGAVSSQKNPETGHPSFLVIPHYNPTNVNLMPEGTSTLPIVSLDLGETWKEVKGLPEGINVTSMFWHAFLPVASDRVNGNVFYLWANNKFYVSEDWGVSWKETATLTASWDSWGKVCVRAVPNSPGEVWVGLGLNGAYHSTDGGKSFTKVPNIGEVVSLGFGKEAPDSKFATVYLYGVVDGADGMYRSTDGGSSWDRINDDTSKLGNIANFIAGDRQTFGVVYAGSDGSGLYVGMPADLKITEKSSQGDVDDSAKSNVYYNGKAITFIDAPIMKNKTLMVSAGEMLKYFRAKRSWDSETNSLNINRKEYRVSLSSFYTSGLEYEVNASIKVDSSEAILNGQSIKMSESAILLNDVMYVPIETFCKIFNSKLIFDETSGKYNILDQALLIK